MHEKHTPVAGQLAQRSRLQKVVVSGHHFKSYPLHCSLSCSPSHPQPSLPLPFSQNGHTFKSDFENDHVSRMVSPEVEVRHVRPKGASAPKATGNNQPQLPSWKQGSGTITYANGDKYTGDFKVLLPFVCSRLVWGLGVMCGDQAMA